MKSGRRSWGSSVAKEINRIWGLLNGHFSALQEHVRRVNQATQFTPADGWEVFKPDYEKSTDEIAHFEINPLLINMPERGNLPSNDLFVVFAGRISCDVNAALNQKLLTRGFASKVGYFARKRSALDHVYGAHYDFDIERLAHPAFHAQLGSYSDEFLPYVLDYGRLNLPIENDRMQGLLQNIRVPIAQLDFFSCLIQLVADHLLWEDSGTNERQVFDDLVKLDHLVQGTTAEIPSLVNGSHIPCHRGSHWYTKAVQAL